MSEDKSERYTKEWIRDNWDHELDTAPREVQLAKVAHEYHIALPGLVGAFVVAFVQWLYAAPELRIIMAALGTFAGSYALFFPYLWCSTLSDGSAD